MLDTIFAIQSDAERIDVQDRFLQHVYTIQQLDEYLPSAHTSCRGWRVGFVGECRISAFSPDVSGNGVAAALPVGPWTTSIDIASTGLFSSNFIAYYVADASSPSLTAYVYFGNYGGIYVYGYNTEFNYAGPWNTPDYGNLTIVADPCNDIVEYLYDGQVVATVNGSGNSLTVNRVLYMTDNAGQIWDVDNNNFEYGDPCPTTCGADGIEPGEQCEFEKVCFGGDNDHDPCESAEDCPGGECLEGDSLCPGRCNPPGTENECMCALCAGLCNFTDLPNGTTSSRDVCASSGWFTFVADTPATAIETCGSEGFDSFLVVFTNSDGGDNCQSLDTVVSFNEDCGTDEFGDGSDPLASCYDRAGPGLGPGFPWEACLCVPTTIGQRYWVWEAKGGEILDANIRITKTKRLTCGEVWENGTCCDDLNGICTDEVAPENCTGDFETFSLNKLCESPSVTCEPITGACCDRLDGFCSETIKGECSGAQPLWTARATCEEVVCDPVMGACCNTRFGTCTNNIILANCMGENLYWTKGESCNDQTCPDPFIPTVSQWGLMVLTLLLLIGGKIYFNRRNISAQIQ